MLDKIRFYPEISEIQLFHGYYVGNHYEFLLLPDKFAFEVIETYFSGSIWNPVSQKVSIAQDYEGFNGRKTYASSVTGAYYTARLALCEHLTKIKKQAACLVMREERPEYNAPLGVGILRELSRAAFKTRENAYKALIRQLDYNEDGIAIVEQDDTILNVPTGKNIIVTVLRKGFEMTKAKLIEELDYIFF